MSFTPPDIIRCDAWGAQPAKTTIQVLDTAPVKIVIHHTADPNTSDFSMGRATSLARSIQNSHFGRGWSDSGQHFLVSRGGYVLEGRHGSLDAMLGGRTHVVGAHAQGQNEDSVGIENEGTYTSVEPPSALWSSLAELCAFICQHYGIGPKQIFGHRNYNATQCPGDMLYLKLDSLRSTVASLLSGRCEVKDWF
jgi:hypothetical protein